MKFLLQCSLDIKVKLCEQQNSECEANILYSSVDRIEYFFNNTLSNYEKCTAKHGQKYCMTSVLPQCHSKVLKNNSTTESRANFTTVCVSFTAVRKCSLRHTTWVLASP